MAAVICNYAVFIAWTVIFGTSKISVADFWGFQKIMAILICLGMVSSVLFHYIVEEKPRRGVSEMDEMNEELLQRDLAHQMRVKDWFSEPQFYQVAGIYLSTGVFVHLSQIYLPLYFHNTLKPKSSLSLVIPLVMFSSGFLSSMAMKPLNRIAGRKVTFWMAAITGLSAAVLVYSGCGQNETGIFFVAILFGASGSAMLVTSLALTAELIDKNTETSAFVFGAFSFVDKVTPSEY